MTRFNITLKEGVTLVDYVMKKNQGGEIYIPKLKSFYIRDLAKAINPKKKIKIIGIRKGEKLHEELINYEESRYCVETKDLYILFPNSEEYGRYKQKFKKIKMQSNRQFTYNSYNNKHFLNLKDLRKIVFNN